MFPTLCFFHLTVNLGNHSIPTHRVSSFLFMATQDFIVCVYYLLELKKIILWGPNKHTRSPVFHLCSRTGWEWGRGHPGPSSSGLILPPKLLSGPSPIITSSSPQPCPRSGPEPLASTLPVSLCSPYSCQGGDPWPG